MDGGAYELTFNAAPETVVLSNASVAENQPAGTLIGTLTTEDHDLEDLHVQLLELCTATTTMPSRLPATNC